MPSNLLNDDVDVLNDYMVTNDNVGPAIIEGEGVEVRDEDGKTYLDFEGGPGANSVGHAHPKLVDAVSEQARRMFIVPGRYHSRNTLSLARRIAKLTGDRLRRIFFANSGAEASDGSIKLAMKHASVSGRSGHGIIALQHGFHGRLSLPLSLTGISKYKKGMGPYAGFPNVAHAPVPYCYRCPLGATYPKCGVKCADYIQDIIDTGVAGAASVMIGEPILGVGGVIVPPDEYWPKVEAICRKNGMTVIYDEVFTGFGRTGRMFGHQHFDGQPDIMGFAKGIGGGVPLAGFIATDELGTAFEPGDHSTTYGSKNQLGIAAGHAVLDLLEEEHLADNAAAMGEMFLSALCGFQRDYPMIGEVRGKGLFIGIEFVSGDDAAPSASIAKAFCERSRELGVLVAATGVNGNVVRITPPLIADQRHLEAAINVFGRVLREIET